jgi:hypothetical protein
MKRMRWLARFAAAMLLAATLAGCSDTKILSDVLYYAPAQKYVVKVNYSRNVDDRPDDYYFVFDTEQEARDFVQAVNSDPHTRLANDRLKYGDRTQAFLDIDKGAGPVPPRVRPDAINRALDRVTPPIPTGPTPQ